MSFTDATYYILDANIPTSDYNDLTLYIARYEKEVLKKLLGYELWKLVDAYNATTSPQRIKDIVEGKEYTVDGVLMNWNGLINNDKISLLSYYVLYNFMRETSTSLQTTGVTRSIDENANVLGVAQKMVDAWGKMRELYGYYGQDTYAASALNFLLNYESDYLEWDFTDIGNVNMFDL